MTTMEKLCGAPPGHRLELTPNLCLLNDDLAHSLPGQDAVHVAPELRGRTLIVLDHDIPAGSFDSAFRQKALIDLSRQYGLPFIQAEGIGYALLCKDRLEPGQLVLGWGDHVCSVGAAGALGLQLSDQELFRVLKQGTCSVQVPELAGLHLTGALPPGVSAFDAALSLLPGLEELYKGKLLLLTDESGLDLEERMSFCQLLHRFGALSAIFASEETAGRLLDAGMTQTCDLTQARVSVVLPGCMTHIQPLDGLKPVRVDACFIGGCVGGHIGQLRQAAEILRGKRVKREVRLLVGFASNEDYLAAMREGLVEVFLDCGAQVANPGCASCRTTSIGVVGDGEVMASTGCYNYPGCCGTQASRVCLAAPRAVAKAALSGYLQA